MKTAILVDGGFYRKRSLSVLGNKTAKERANELDDYCKRHLHEKHGSNDLYRIFYYDCPPMAKKVFHPLTRTQIDFSKTSLYTWTNEFFDELKRKRKFALRMGKLADAQACYTLKPEVVRKLCNKSTDMCNVTENDFIINLDQKGVDMKIGFRYSVFSV